MLNKGPKAAGLIAAMLLGVTGVHGSSGWRFSNPKPHGNNILEMAIDKGVVWQVGDRGQVYTSRNLDTWIPRDTGVTRSLRSIAFFGGKTFISTEAGGVLAASSQDAFQFVDLGTEDWLEGIAASPSGLVAVGDNGAIYFSPDGNQWTRRGDFTNWLRSVAYGLNTFVTVGEDGFLATSGDGQSWQKQNLITRAHLNKVEFINDRFWVVGDEGTVLTNNFRLNFLPVSINVPHTNTFFAVAGNSNEVVIAGDSTLLLGNLQTGGWSEQADADSPALAPLWPYYSALWDGRLFLIGGRTGLKVEGFRTNASAPLQWYSDTQPTRNWLWSATRAPEFYAASGSAGTIVTSLDGIDWTREVVPAAAESEVLLGIGGNGLALVAVGSGGVILRSPNVMTNTVSTNAAGQIVTNQTSLFGVIWEPVTSPVTSDLQAVAATANGFLIGGSRGTLFTSADGRSWNPQASGVTNFLSGATSWPQGWVVTGAAGAILTSPNGSQWTRRNSGASEWVYAVRFAGGKLVAVGENGLILTSEDGVTWTRRTSGTTEWLNDVVFAQGAWHAVGGSGVLLSSSDAATWNTSKSITSKSLYALATDGQQLIAAGLEGVILRKQPVATSPVNFVTLGADGLETLFLFEGLTDQRFVVEQTEALGSAWVPSEELEITDSSGILIYGLPQDSARAKFFRTRLLPR